eukprot:554971_1
MLVDKFNKVLIFERDYVPYEERIEFCTSNEFRMAKNIIKEMCFVAQDYAKELELLDVNFKNKDIERYYELPDGYGFFLWGERFKTAEIFFQPPRLSNRYRSGDINVKKGVHKLCNDAIQKCDKYIQNEMYGNIVLCGGNSMFEGMSKRIENELYNLVPDSMTPVIIAPEKRQYLSCVGGCMLSSMSIMNELWISRNDYMEGKTYMRKVKSFEHSIFHECIVGRFVNEIFGEVPQDIICNIKQFYVMQ